MENSTLSRDELSTSDLKHVWYMILAERGSHNYCRSWKSRLCFLQYGRRKINLWSSLGYNAALLVNRWVAQTNQCVQMWQCSALILRLSVWKKNCHVVTVLQDYVALGVINLLLSTCFRQVVSASCHTSPSHLCYRATLTASYSLFVPDSKEYITDHCCISPDCFRMDSNAYPLIILLLENAILNNLIIV